MYEFLKLRYITGKISIYKLKSFVGIFITQEQYESILESKQKYNFNKTSMKESVDFYNKIAENYLTEDEIVEIFGE